MYAFAVVWEGVRMRVDFRAVVALHSELLCSH